MMKGQQKNLKSKFSFCASYLRNKKVLSLALSWLFCSFNSFCELIFPFIFLFPHRSFHDGKTEKRREHKICAFFIWAILICAGDFSLFCWLSSHKRSQARGVPLASMPSSPLFLFLHFLKICCCLLCNKTQLLIERKCSKSLNGHTHARMDTHLCRRKTRKKESQKIAHS